MENKFKSAFKPYVCEGDRITAYVKIDNKTYDVTARVLRDDCQDKPDERNDGFWPSQDKDAAGYVEPDKYEAEMKKAKRIMSAWKKDAWFYCGIVLTVELDEEMIDKHAASLWGIECNYPESQNEYLTEVANELLDEWMHGQRTKK